jgi:hypothetical protein
VHSAEAFETAYTEIPLCWSLVVVEEADVVETEKEAVAEGGCCVVVVPAEVVVDSEAAAEEVGEEGPRFGHKFEAD